MQLYPDYLLMKETISDSSNFLSPNKYKALDSDRELAITLLKLTNQQGRLD